MDEYLEYVFIKKGFKMFIRKCCGTQSNNLAGYKLLESYLGLPLSIDEFTININIFPYIHIPIIVYILMYYYKLLYRKLIFSNLSSHVMYCYFLQISYSISTVDFNCTWQ